MMDEQDKRLIHRCLNGEIEAFAGLIDRYEKTIFNIAFRLTGDYDDARDVTQTVFVRAYEKLGEYDPRFKFFSWIYKMAMNESLNLLSRRKRMAPLGESMVSPERTPDECLETDETGEIVCDAIEELPIDYRVILILRHFADLSYRELGFILDLPEKTVKSRLFTARQRLGDILRQRGIIEYG